MRSCKISIDRCTNRQTNGPTNKGDYYGPVRLNSKFKMASLYVTKFTKNNMHIPTKFFYQYLYYYLRKMLAIMYKDWPQRKIFSSYPSFGYLIILPGSFSSCFRFCGGT